MSAPEGQTVLVVDDDAVIRVTVQDYLSEAGFTVYEAADGDAGLEAFERLRPDLALLDVTMPGMDGYTLCEALRATPAGTHTPIVMLTGRDDAASVERAYAAGATDFVSKPLNCTLIVHRLHYLLRAKQTGDELRASRESLAHAQRIAKLGSWSFDLASRCVRHCAVAGGIVRGDARAGELSLRRLYRTIHADDRAKLKRLYRRSFQDDRPDELEFRIVRPDGSERVVHLESEAQTDGQARLVELRGTLQDVTERHRAQARIRELAFFDCVTGLPNRALFAEHINRAIELAKRSKRIAAVLFVDLDRFKLVNDSWGHETGDALLQQVAQRFNECLRDCDVIARDANADEPESATGALARLGGDEFVVLITDMSRAENAAAVARRLLAALSQPFIVENTTLYVTASIGISVYPDDGNDAAVLIKRADMAMYATKRESSDGFRFFTPSMQAHATWRLSIEARMRRGLEREEFTLHYQPLVAASDERLLSFEALVRWDEPGRGLVSPAEFIPVAEETGLIVPLGAWVMARACRDIRRIQQIVLGAPTVSVNLSAAQLRHPDLLRTVRESLEAAGLAPAHLELELTESMLMGNTDKSLSLLHALRDAGVVLSIDDFGTGYSSLSYIKRLPIQVLKIDRCFVRDLVTDLSDAAIVRGTIQLAHSLGLAVVAEGVEHREQRDRLREYGCDRLQGFYYTRPLPFGDVIDWVTERSPLCSELRQ